MGNLKLHGKAPATVGLQVQVEARAGSAWGHWQGAASDSQPSLRPTRSSSPAPRRRAPGWRRSDRSGQVCHSLWHVHSTSLTPSRKLAALGPGGPWARPGSPAARPPRPSRELLSMRPPLPHSPGGAAAAACQPEPDSERIFEGSTAPPHKTRAYWLRGRTGRPSRRRPTDQCASPTHWGAGCG
jgi:hypothetical protein